MAGPVRMPRGASVETVEGLVPPHSVEGEQAVLGGLLIDPVAWDQVADVVAADDFYRNDHRLIFGALAELAAAGKPIDVVTVSEQLQRRGQLDEAGGLAYLGTLARDTPTAANVRAAAMAVGPEETSDLEYSLNETAPSRLRVYRAAVQDAAARARAAAEGHGG